MSESPNPTAALLAKLKAVYEAVQFVEKRGQNDHHKYSYAQALDVIRDVRAALLAQGVIVIPGTVPGSVAHHTETGGKSFVTTVDLFYRFMDVETGASIQVPWTGAGADTGGDKGLYKAYTGGLKYALLSMFLLPLTDDPEHDGLTAAPPPAESTVDKDADRPVAPRIPIDRARSIAEACIAAGLASGGEGQVFEMTPVLKAKLATMNVQKVGALNVDQAEEVEAFIAAEVAA
jgi:hypothetical protein